MSFARECLIGVMGIVAVVMLSSCSGAFYWWSYDRAASPVATSAYIRAVMAAEAGNDALALHYYDIALSREDSPKAREEREAVKRRLAEKP